MQAFVKATREVAAVKVITLEPGEDLDEVLNEVEILKQCDHTNIVKYFGCYRLDVANEAPQIWVCKPSPRIHTLTCPITTTRLAWSFAVAVPSRPSTRVCESSSPPHC